VTAGGDLLCSPAPGEIVGWVRKRRDFNLVIAVGAGKPLDFEGRTFSWHLPGKTPTDAPRITRDINGLYCCQNWSLKCIARTA